MSNYTTVPEALESRIAPAVLIDPANALLAHYTDTDGDTITLSLNHGDWHDAVFTTVAQGSGELLQRIDLQGAAGFAKAKIRITSEQNGGDGLVRVGDIVGAGLDLAAIVVDGDLGHFSAGN